MNRRRRPAFGAAGAVAAVVAVLLTAGGLFWVQWNQPTRQAMPDTYWYARQAVIDSGASTAHAADVASQIECAARNRYARELGMRPACHRYPATRPDPRYMRIFTTRPGFSLLAAPLVRLAGPWRGMEWATALASVLAALLGYAAVRALGGSAIAGLAAVVLLFALPSGYWITRMLPEGAMLAGCLATGIGASLLWPRPAGATVAGPGRGRTAAGIALAAAGLLWTYVVKSANGFLLSAVLLAGGAAVAGWAWARARKAEEGLTGSGTAATTPQTPVVQTPVVQTPVVLAALGLAGTVGWLAVSRVAHLPSFTDTIQDMASSHFRGRLSPDPVGYLVGRDAWFIPHWFLVLLRDAWALPLVAAGIAALVWTCGARAVPWLLIGATGPLAVAAHPIGSESDRLVLPVWLPVIIGLALGADRAGRWAIRRWVTRTANGSPPAAHPDQQPGSGLPAAPHPEPSGPGQPGGRTVSLRSLARLVADNISSPPARS